MTALLVGHFVMRVPSTTFFGIVVGRDRNARDRCLRQPAFPSDRVEICYAMISRPPPSWRLSSPR